MNSQPNGELRPGPFSLVIFGATGDLTRRKLIPALYRLLANGFLPDQFTIIGFARRPWSDEMFRRNVSQYLAGEPPLVLERFLEGMHYCQGAFQDVEAYQRLASLLDEVDTRRGTRGNRLFYLATPPDAYETIVERLGQTGLSANGPGTWARVIVEKPFGRDLQSARQLNEAIHRVFDESQVYRIDHYLGKETVQNLMVFRFGNGIFEPLWNRQFIDHVQITVAESLGVEGRGDYYDQAGAVRDMIQNHMLQLLSLIAMEPPVAFSAAAVRDEKVKVLQAIRPFTAQDVLNRTVRGQYRTGVVEGMEVPGYTKEPRVDPGSRTETFVALKLFVENWRWSGVPFYLFTGKRLPSRATQIAIRFRKVPHLLFEHTATREVEPNVLLIRIQPEEGIVLRFAAKVPGPAVRIQTVDMQFGYRAAFRVASRDAYERLLLDAMMGDSTLFTREDEVEAAWRLVTSILTGWREEADHPLPTYPAGTWGPQEADRLIEQDGRWFIEP